MKPIVWWGLLALFVKLLAHPIDLVTLELNTTNQHLRIKFLVFHLQNPLGLQEPLAQSALNHKKEIFDYVQKRVEFLDCTLFPLSLTVRNAVLLHIDYRLACRAPRTVAKVDLVLDQNLSCQAVMKVYGVDKEALIAFSPQKRTHKVALDLPEQGWGDFVMLGIEHILKGFDHLLFLFALMAPMLYYQKIFKDAFVGLLKIATAFSFSHSITLSVTLFGLYRPPSAWIEPLIALSIVITIGYALFLRRRGVETWWIAFGFGFVHGFGFADALLQMPMQSYALARTVFGFNLGVELGQVFVIALCAYPLHWLFRRLSWLYTLWLWGALMVATYWFLQRLGWV